MPQVFQGTRTEVTVAAFTPSTGEMSEGQRGSAIYEEQGSLAEHHSGGGVHPHGSVDCSGNYELLKPDGKLKSES